MRSQIIEIRKTEKRNEDQAVIPGPRTVLLQFGLQQKQKTPKPEYQGYIHSDGSSLHGMFASGNEILMGEGRVVRDSTGEYWEFASKSQGNKTTGYLNLLYWPAANQGAFMAFGGKQPKGGLMGGVLFQEKGGAKPDPCGKLLWDTLVVSSDENGEHTIYYRWWHYEKCDKIQFVDASGAIKDGEVDPDKLKPIGPQRDLKVDPKGGKPFEPKKPKGIKITPLSTPLNGDDVGPGEKRSGQVRIFYMTGCDKFREVQFVKNTRTFTPPKNDPTATVPAATKGDWKQDGHDPYDQMPTPNGDTATSDVPAQDPAGLALDKDVKGCPDGTTLTLTWDFETFFYCGTDFLGWASWTMTVVFTVDKGKPTPGAPSISEPEFHQPDEKSQSGGPKK